MAWTRGYDEALRDPPLSLPDRVHNSFDKKILLEFHSREMDEFLCNLMPQKGPPLPQPQKKCKSYRRVFWRDRHLRKIFQCQNTAPAAAAATTTRVHVSENVHGTLFGVI